ncbi:MAG: elongation factor P [Candidatus Melainabacteria bacterium]|jgi:elongation factor P|nr:elongation factor P [Candidatus Melainabacteria bacterium]
MGYVSTNDFKTGLTLEIDSALMQVIEFLHVKPGKGAAFVRSKLRNVLTGQVVEKTFRAGEKLETAHLDRSDMSYLYNDGSEYSFMDTNTFEQITIPASMIGENGIKYLKENMICMIVRHNDKVVMVDIPSHVELEVVDTPPNDKGNTAQGGTKPATLETGATVQVPFFVVNGTIIRVDTRNNSYLDRVN